jgi:CO dehydrogenase nickel-insertion accessory protein CooC1
LNRKVIPRIDDLFVILDPSQKSIKHVGRVKKIAQEAGISYRHLYLVGNYEFDGDAEQRLKVTGETYLGKMDYDAGVKEYNLNGTSLLGLPDDSPACLSVKQILTRAGYKVG